MNVAAAAKQESLFDNERVRFFLRRLTERASSDFRKMLNLTVESYRDSWYTVWLHTLPKIKTWSAAAIASVVTEFEADVQEAQDLTDFVYLRYVYLGYGKDAYGKSNKLKVEMVSFGTLYHALMVRLARTPEMMRASWLTRPEEMERMCMHALSDALHDVAEVRVKIMEREARTQPSVASTARHTRSMVSRVPSTTHRPIRQQLRRFEPPSPPARPPLPEEDEDGDEEDNDNDNVGPLPPPPMQLQHYRPTTVANPVTPSDSASQVNSLGQRFQQQQQQKVKSSPSASPPRAPSVVSALPHRQSTRIIGFNPVPAVIQPREPRISKSLVSTVVTQKTEKTATTDV